MRIAFTGRRSYPPGGGTIRRMTAAELDQLGAELGLDVVGAASVAPYADTERHIRDRRARGLFADMRFTMARPEESCYPQTLLEGAHSVVSAALCYYADAPAPQPGEGRLPRYTWRDASAASTACSSTKTSTSTARRRHAPGSASTARTRC